MPLDLRKGLEGTKVWVYVGILLEVMPDFPINKNWKGCYVA